MIKKIIRGGQTLLHSIRMFAQVARKMICVLGVIFLLGFIGLVYLKTTGHQRYALFKIIEAALKDQLLSDWKYFNTCNCSRLLVKFFKKNVKNLLTRFFVVNF